MAQLVWAPKALDDLEALIQYIARNAPMAARRFAQKLVARVESLSTYPFQGGYVSEDDSQTYRELIQGNYRVIYRVEGQRVIVVAVHHAARLLDTAQFE
ncbi:MAG: type II toxin-antitoxin system RelE/ParE family toxin [Planctomycetes bacterium]|nr:type II toxin-antitoxin system RelE/ParE family toxin [Planctomycetota bacterium]